MREAFRRYAWPGNVRELENTLERGVILCQGEALGIDALPPQLQRLAREPGKDASGAEPAPPEWEKEFIYHTLEKHAWSRPDAAAALQISIDELDFKIKAYGLKAQK